MISAAVERYLATRPPESEDSKRKLVEAGADALPTLLQLIRAVPPSDARRLADIIALMEDPRIVPLLLTVLSEDAPVPLKSSGEKALARIGGAGVFEYLAESFEKPSRYTWGHRVRLMSRLGDTRAIPLLHRKLVELVGDVDAEEPVWTALDVELDGLVDEEDRAIVAAEQSVVAELVGALARLGDNRRTALIGILYGYPRASPELRQAAGVAATVATDDQTFALARAGLHDPHEWVRYAFLEALYFLGVRGVASALADRLTIEPVEPVGEVHMWGNIVSRLEDLTGSDDPEAARAIDATFEEGRCYRKGVPIDYTVLARDTLSDRSFINHELYLRTGGVVGWIDMPMKALPPARIAAEADAWIANEGPKFERGGHYRGGVRRVITPSR